MAAMGGSVQLEQRVPGAIFSLRWARHRLTQSRDDRPARLLTETCGVH